MATRLFLADPAGKEYPIYFSGYYFIIYKGVAYAAFSVFEKRGNSYLYGQMDKPVPSLAAFRDLMNYNISSSVNFRCEDKYLFAVNYRFYNLMLDTLYHLHESGSFTGAEYRQCLFRFIKIPIALITDNPLDIPAEIHGLEKIAKLENCTINDAFQKVFSLLEILKKERFRQSRLYYVQGASRGLLDEFWNRQLEKSGLPKSAGLYFYHVCRTVDVPRILKRGIFHNTLATMTPSLAMALLSALSYTQLGRPSSILKVKIDYKQIFYTGNDDMGPGYLPMKIVPYDQLQPGTDFPQGLYEKIVIDCRSHNLPGAYHVSPDHLSLFYNCTVHDVNIAFEKMTGLNYADSNIARMAQHINADSRRYGL